jgi:hypothetical protein
MAFVASGGILPHIIENSFLNKDLSACFFVTVCGS